MCVERDEIRFGTALSSEKVCWGTGYPGRQVEGEALLPRRSVGTGDTGACEVGITGQVHSPEFAVSTEMCSSRVFAQAKVRRPRGGVGLDAAQFLRLSLE